MGDLREHRVYGPPGTGKTTYLARQCQLAAHRYRGDQVMVASLTRAAAQEVAGRKTDIPADNIGTLHAHAYRALDRPNIAESKEGIAAWNTWIKTKMPTWQITDPRAIDVENAPMEAGGLFGSEGEQLIAEVGVWRARMTPTELWPPRVARFYARWCEWKAAEGWVDFTDLLERCIAEVSRPPSAPKVMFLDEAQDFSRLELTLARKWGATCEQIVIVGDPDQNLYQWRGSDPEVFTEGEAASVHVLEQSYRVPQAVHRYAVRWIEQIQGREPIAYHPTSEPGELVRLPGRGWKDPLPLVRKQVAEDLANGMTVMLLTTCTYMLFPLISCLRSEGIPFWNPYRVNNGAWNPLAGAGRLRAYLKPLPEADGGQGQLWTWDDVRKWIDPLRAQGVLERGIKTWIESKAAPDLLGSEPQPATLEAVIQCFKPEHQDRVFDLDVDWWHANLLASRRKQADYPVQVYRRHGAAALHEDPKLIVGTIHSVKGGEADSVYVFPDLSRSGYEVWLRAQARDALYRQFYVAFTRARSKLTLCGASGFERVPFPAPEEEAP